MKSIKKLTFFFLLFFTFLGNVFAFSSSVKEIEPSKAYSLVKKNKAIIFDVRSPKEFQEQSIPSSVLIPMERLKESINIFKNLDDDITIVIHCKTGVRGYNATKILNSEGVKNVYNLKGGIEGWKAENLEVLGTVKHGKIDIMRQVQIIVGVLLILFSALVYLKNKKFIIGCLFIAGGLIFAGLTGSCGMAKVLSFAPWN